MSSSESYLLSAEYSTPILWRMGDLVRCFLRSEARLLMAHVIRFFLTAFCLCAFGLTEFFGLMFGAPGLLLLQLLTGANLVVIVLLGPLMFSRLVLEEFDVNSAGLLQLAGIPPQSLLLTRGLSKVWTTGTILSVQIPFAFLSIVLGGVTTHQIVAVVVGLLVLLCVVASLSVWIASSLRKAEMATALTWAALMGYLLLPVGCTAIRIVDKTSFLASLKVCEWLATGDLLTLIMSPLLKGQFNGSVITTVHGVHLAIAIILTLLSVYQFAWKSGGLMAKPARRNMVRSLKARPRFQHVGPAALYEKDLRRYAYRDGSWAYSLLVWAWVPALALIIADTLVNWSRNGLLLIAALLPIISARHTSSVIATELREQTWSVLKMTPLSVRDIVTAKLGAALALSLPEILIAGVAQLMAALLYIEHQSTSSSWGQFANSVFQIQLIICWVFFCGLVIFSLQPFMAFLEVVRPLKWERLGALFCAVAVQTATLWPIPVMMISLIHPIFIGIAVAGATFSIFLAPLSRALSISFIESILLRRDQD